MVPFRDPACHSGQKLTLRRGERLKKLVTENVAISILGKEVNEAVYSSLGCD